MKHRLYIFCVVTLLLTNLQAKNTLIATIPFEMVGSYIILKAKINQSAPLNLILDTGLRNCIITELPPNDSIQLNLGETRTLQGLGSGKNFYAYESSENNIKLGKLALKNRYIYVFKENVFNLSKQLGTNINGLIGMDLFRDHVVSIDYIFKKIRLYSPDNFMPAKGFGYMPMTIQRQKMYINLSVLETDSARQQIKMLIDTGAELTAWFETLTNKAVSIPEKSIRGRIGEGLSGEILGVYARVPQLCISDFCVKNPVVVFPDSLYIAGTNSDRDGTIGGQLLSRFHLIIDTHTRRFYFKPNANFKKPFVYNIAGVEAALTDGMFVMPEVINVWNDSPAERAGLRQGDIISEINSLRTSEMTISEVRHYFERASNQPLKIKYERNGSYKIIEINMKPKI